MLFRSDRKSTRLNSSHLVISYAVFCLKKKKRPMASTAGLGTFGVHPGSLPLRGLALRAGCEGTDLKVEPAPRPDEHHLFFFFNDAAPTEISPLPLHPALPL